MQSVFNYTCRCTENSVPVTVAGYTVKLSANGRHAPGMLSDTLFRNVPPATKPRLEAGTFRVEPRGNIVPPVSNIDSHSCHDRHHHWHIFSGQNHADHKRFHA